MSSSRRTTYRAYLAKSAGKYADGSGLYVEVRQGKPLRYSFRYSHRGRSHEMGLGTARDIPLAVARERADELRQLLKRGVDPLMEKHRGLEAEEVNREKAKKLERQTKAIFSLVAEEFIAQKEAEWKNCKHRQQWSNTLAAYAYPVLGDKPVNSITRQDILRVLEPHWLTKNETMTRVRQRIESVLDYALAMNYREGNNPAEWKSSLRPLLASPAKVQLQKKRHFPALDYELLPQFMADLQSLRDLPTYASLSSLALQFTILTGGRTSEALQATWSEIDWNNKRWIIPEERMKADKEHRVPLSDAAIAVLKVIPERSELIFQGRKKGKPICNVSMLNILKRMNRSDITVHGFRSTFRDWVEEQTDTPWRVAETALSHQLKDGAAKAYQRRDLINKRVRLMDAWAEYCLSHNKKVIQLHA